MYYFGGISIAYFYIIVIENFKDFIGSSIFVRKFILSLFDQHEYMISYLEVLRIEASVIIHLGT